MHIATWWLIAAFPSKRCCGLAYGTNRSRVDHRYIWPHVNFCRHHDDDLRIWSDASRTCTGQNSRRNPVTFHPCIPWCSDPRIGAWKTPFPCGNCRHGDVHFWHRIHCGVRHIHCDVSLFCSRRWSPSCSSLAQCKSGLRHSHNHHTGSRQLTSQWRIARAGKPLQTVCRDHWTHVQFEQLILFFQCKVCQT